MHSPLRLYGRSGELAILETLLGKLRTGDGGALVLTAPPGLGRTALLRQAAAHYLRGHGGPVLYASAAPTEQRLPYSGLHALLCSAPGPLSLAPDTVLSSGITPGALLGLLRALGAEQPLLVCVDDAHLWDPDSRAALGFAARRLGAGSRVAVVIGAADETAFAGLPALRLGPLDDDAATALLDRLTDGAADVDPVVRSELLREAAGNPRLLAGLAGRLTPGQLAGRTALPYPLPGGESVLDAHAAHLDGLSCDTHTLLLLAAAAEEHEPDGAGSDAALLLRAGARAGLSASHLDRVLFAPAGSAGALQRAGSRVHFSHPLLRRAVLHRAPPAAAAPCTNCSPDCSAAVNRTARGCPHSSRRPARPPGRTPASPNSWRGRPPPRARTANAPPRWPGPPRSPRTTPCARPGSPPPPNRRGWPATPAGPAPCWPVSAPTSPKAPPPTCAACSRSGTAPSPTPARRSWPRRSCWRPTTRAALWTRCSGPRRRPGPWGTPSRTWTP